MSGESIPVAVGHVYVSRDYPGGARYQVLALWDGHAWVHVTFPNVSAGGQPKEPKTYPLSFFEHCDLLYVVSDRLGGAA